MPTTTIPWGDGSGDNLYLTYPSASGDQTVTVTSDANTGAARTKVVTFSASGVPSVTLTINQDAGGVSPVFHKYLIYNGSAYVDTGVSIPSRGSIYIEDCGYETTLGYQGYYRGNNGNNTRYIGVRASGSTNSTKRVMSCRYNSVTAKTNKDVSWTTGHFDLWQTPLKLGIDDTYNTYSEGTTQDKGTLQIGIDYGSPARNFTGKHSDVYVYGDDAYSANLYTDRGNYTPVAVMKPCTYNGVAGLWITTTDNPDGYFAGASGLAVGD